VTSGFAMRIAPELQNLHSLVPYPEVEPIEHGAVVQLNLDAVLACTIAVHPETAGAEPDVGRPVTLLQGIINSGRVAVRVLRLDRWSAVPALVLTRSPGTGWREFEVRLRPQYAS
jgi:hypothetical protein